MPKSTDYTPIQNWLLALEAASQQQLNSTLTGFMSMFYAVAGLQPIAVGQDVPVDREMIDVITEIVLAGSMELGDISIIYKESQHPLQMTPFSIQRHGAMLVAIDATGLVDYPLQQRIFSDLTLSDPLRVFLCNRIVARFSQGSAPGEFEGTVRERLAEKLGDAGLQICKGIFHECQSRIIELLLEYAPLKGNPYHDQLRQYLSEQQRSSALSLHNMIPKFGLESLG